MQDAHGKGVVEDTGQWQMINVGLDHVCIFQLTSGRKSRFNRRAQIDADHLTRSPARGQLRMAAFAAPAFEHHFVPEELRLHRANPTEELFGVAFIRLGEVSPLPAKVRGGGGLVFLDAVEARKSRYTAG